jgi:hypothetical protein
MERLESVFCSCEGRLLWIATTCSSAFALGVVLLLT